MGCLLHERAVSSHLCVGRGGRGSKLLRLPERCVVAGLVGHLIIAAAPAGCGGVVSRRCLHTKVCCLAGMQASAACKDPKPPVCVIHVVVRRSQDTHTACMCVCVLSGGNILVCMCGF